MFRISFTRSNFKSLQSFVFQMSSIISNSSILLGCKYYPKIHRFNIIPKIILGSKKKHISQKCPYPKWNKNFHKSYICIEALKRTKDKIES